MSYCTIGDARRKLSSEAVDLRLDDGDDGSDALEAADAEINQAAWYLYSEASLLTNVWVKQRATDIAAYELCIRRGNPAPASVVERYTRALELLEKVRSGSLLIPKCVMSKASAPTMSNVRPTLRPYPRSVVERSRSTGKPEGYVQNNRDPWDRILGTVNLDFVI